MTDQSFHPGPARHHRPPKAEYLIYFALVLTLSLPFAAIGWSLAALRGDRRRMAEGIWSRAMSEARCIVPTIFSA